MFGITDPFGVTLINRAHRFPLLVEEEEKTHGALLANTTHGALYRALGSILLYPDKNLVVLSQPAEDLGDLIPRHVYNRISAQKDWTLSRALSIHEAFAKYCAFCLQYTLEDNRPVPALDDLWDEEVERYDLLLEIARAIGMPGSVVFYPAAFKIAYAAAKAILNIADFESLLAISSPRQLYDRLATPSWSESLEDRFSVVMAELGSMRAQGRLDYFGILSGETPLEPVLVEALRRADLHGQLGTDHATLSARSVLLGKRLASLATGILYCHLEDMHLGFSLQPWIDLDERFLHPDGRLKTYADAQSIGGRLGSDPSLTVSYDCYAKDGIWPEDKISVHSLEEMREVVVYLAAGTGDTIDCHALLKPHGAAQPLMFVDRGHTWKTLEPELARVGKTRLVIVMLPASFGSHSLSVSPKQTLGEALEYLGTTAYWVPVSSPDQIIRAPTYAYRRFDGASRAVPRGPVGLLSEGPCYATVGATPLYVVQMVGDTLSRAPSDSFGLHGAPRPITVSVDNIDQIVSDAGEELVSPKIVAAARVYEHFYGLGKLPGPIPLYDPLTLFEIIHQSAKDL